MDEPGRTSGLMLVEDVPESRASIADYQVLSFVSERGNALFYRAQRAGEDPVDLLLFRLEPDAASAFEAEVARAMKLSHPNLLTPRDFGGTEDPEERWVTLENIPGTSLDQLITQQPMEPRRAALLIQRVAEGLQVLHGAGLFLGCVQPRDIVLVGSPANTQPLIPGSPFLVGPLLGGGAPEFCAPEGPIGPRADQFPLGKLLQRSLRGVGKTPKHIPDELLDLVGRLTRPDPSERFEHMQRVIERIERYLKPESLVPAAAPVAPPQKRGWGGVLTILLLVAILGIAGIGFLLTRPGPRTIAPRDPSLPPVSVVEGTPSAPQLPPEPVVEAPDLPVPEPAAPASVSTPDPTPMATPEAPVTPEADDPPAPEVVPETPSVEDPAPGEDVTEPSSPEPTTSTRPVPAPADAPPAPAEVPPAPAGPDLSALSGRFSGTRTGRPLTLDLRLQPGGSLTGASYVQVGPNRIQSALQGRWTASGDVIRIDISETGSSRPTRFEGVLTPNGGEGTVSVNGKSKGSWTVTR